MKRQNLFGAENLSKEAQEGLVISMNAAKLFGDYIWNVSQKGNPGRAGKLVNTGLDLYGWFIKHFGDKRMPKAYRYLMSGGLQMVADGLNHPENLAYTNIFAPVEILECFGLTCVSMECLSSYLAGFFLEDRLLDSTDSRGIATTLCSYHRNFLGAIDEGILPKARFAVTTSTICDGNINSFRHLQRDHGIPTYYIDIPHEDSPDAEEYVVEQLQEMIAQLEELTGKKLDCEELKERLRSENRAKAHYLSFVRKRLHHTYPQTLTLVLFQLFASHLDIGMEWAEKVFEMMDEEVEQYPDTDEKKLMWLHVEPYSQPTLQSYFNYGDKVSILCGDFDLDYMETMDAEHPLQAIARKIICNIYNGDYTRKTEAIERYVKELKPDGVVQFCSWGCKQSAGGVELMKEKMRELDVPMLILDGDALDRRNCPDGQIKTRFEAFMEVLNDGEVRDRDAALNDGQEVTVA